MTVEQTIAGFFRLDDDAWMRHANPWSVFLRNTVLPALIIAFWSRLWLGWWAVVPVSLALLWMWLNPRLFKAPATLDHWASKSVLGERVWLNRDIVPVPVRHQTVPDVLSAIGGIGMLLVIWGVLEFSLWPTLSGAAVVYVSKLWFLDRMVWLWEDMKEATPEYGSWRNIAAGEKRSEGPGE